MSLYTDEHNDVRPANAKLEIYFLSLEVYNRLRRNSKSKSGISDGDELDKSVTSEVISTTKT